MKKRKKNTVSDKFLAKNFNHRPKTAIAVFLLSFMIGINTLNHSFTLDDEIYYSGNKIAQKGMAGVKDMFTKGSTSGFKQTGKKDLYRPLVMLSFGIEKNLFNNNPHSSHFVQILLYACACMLLYSLLNIFFSSFHFIIPLLITLLFAAHPVHTEVIASIKSRDEIFAFLFSILALRQFIRISDKKSEGKIFWGLFFLLCALLSKESAVMMVVVIPLSLFYFSRLTAKKISYLTLLSSGVLLLYLLMRSNAVPFSTVTLKPNLIDNALMAAKTNSEMLATNFVLLGLYFKFLFIPYPLSYDYSYSQVPIVNWNNFFAIISLTVYLSVFVYAVVRLKKKDPVSYGILFFLFTLFLSSNLLFKIDATIGIRFLFTPLLGFCIVVVFMGYKIFKIDPGTSTPFQQNKNIIIFYSFLIGAYSILTIIRNADWKDNFTLFSHDVGISPNSTRIHSGLGFEYARKAMHATSINQRNEFLENSIEHYKRAVEIYPAHPDAYYNLGVAYFNIGEKEKSMQSYYKASEVNPKLKDPLKELGGIYYNDHRNDSALYYFKRALTLDSVDEQASSIVRYLEGK